MNSISDGGCEEIDGHSGQPFCQHRIPEWTFSRLYVIQVMFGILLLTQWHFARITWHII